MQDKSVFNVVLRTVQRTAYDVIILFNCFVYILTKVKKLEFASKLFEIYIRERSDDVCMCEPSLPGHLDTQQCLGGHHRVGGSQQVGHDWTDVGPSHFQHAISLQIQNQTNIRNLGIKLVKGFIVTKPHVILVFLHWQVLRRG